MGLDVVVYTEVEPVEGLDKAEFANLDADSILDRLNEEAAGKPYRYRMFPLMHFPERAEELDAGTIYRVTEGKRGFRAGSCSAYCEWREWLESMSNYGFELLVEFTDSDGTLGNGSCQTLAEEFNAFEFPDLEDSGLVSPDIYDAYRELFEEFKAAFNEAAETWTGCIVFC